MIDERDPLAGVNPVHPDELDELVAMDRSTLFELLEADDRNRTDQRPTGRLRAMPGRRSRSGTRTGYVGAMAAAAAVVIAVVTLSSTGRSPVTDVGSTDDPTLTTSPVVDDPTSTPTPTPESTADAQPTTATTDSPPVDPNSTTDRATASTVEPADDPTTGVASTRATTDQDRGPTTVATIDGPFDAAVDLLALHHDFTHLDDVHAAVAAREITADLGVTVHVVSGTTETGYDGHIHDFEPVMQSLWGDRWLDASAERDDAVRRSADAWLSAIDGGGRVWVADGGASDFTAQVVQEIRQRRPEVDTAATIGVVQHNRSNESATSADNLRLLERATGYERIEDGNDANDTADLNRPSDGFEIAALAGPHGAGWSIAFDALPAADLDFSDTVEVLHILGVGLDEVADTDDFARRFLD